ncbi:hypothetical protein HYPSUDRAFT_1047652 [Hypholoma sublateritium FD-334 SS-4]|uniref:Uncharacterized protein n=1 Tax=Hypholoma sublateritium (strain FD-334 SS-4) TaxID=945553 RepID=A0A0D2NK02_HYPSF|nr:hypothetical protein HYPSUDRAFT_1047652 [Hypholoma sublateritium FD-334 SS-4]
MEPWVATPPTRTLWTSYLPMSQSLTRRHALASHQPNEVANMRLRKINSSSMDRTMSICIAISLVHTAIESSNKRGLSDKYSALRKWFAGAQSGSEADNRYQPQLASSGYVHTGNAQKFQMEMLPIGPSGPHTRLAPTLLIIRFKANAMLPCSKIPN